MLTGLLKEENVPPTNDHKRKKDNKKRDGVAAPPLDRIPLPTLSASVTQARRQMQREPQKKVCIHLNILLL